MPKRQHTIRRGRLRPADRAGIVALIILVIAAVLGFGADREMKDRRFNASLRAVFGAAHTPISAVIAAASISPTQNAWLLDRKAISRRLERLPWVKTAKISVSWPNRVQIGLTEREPAGLVVLGSSDGEEPVARYALIDDSQRILTFADRPDAAQGLPVLLITPAPAAALRPGEDLNNKDVAKALEALARLRSSGLQVSQVAIAPATGISATADRHLRVLFGEDEDLAKKAALFQAIVAKISQPERIAYIDVRSVHAPTVLYR